MFKTEFLKGDAFSDDDEIFGRTMQQRLRGGSNCRKSSRGHLTARTERTYI